MKGWGGWLNLKVNSEKESSKCFGHEEESNLSVNDLILVKVNSERILFGHEEASNRCITKEKNEIQK